MLTGCRQKYEQTISLIPIPSRVLLHPLNVYGNKEINERTLVTVQCAYCGSAFEVEKNLKAVCLKDDQETHFCSQEHAIAKLFGIVKKFDETIAKIKASNS